MKLKNSGDLSLSARLDLMRQMVEVKHKIAMLKLAERVEGII